MTNNLTLDYNGKHYELFSAAALFAAGVPQATVNAAVLAQAQTAAIQQIDTAAAAARGRYITTAFGQSDTYARKLFEAQAYIAAASPASPDPAIYPVLSAQATAVGESVAQVAAAVIAADAAWATAAGKIEAIRVPAKSAVRAATTDASAMAASQTAITALVQV